MKLKLTTLSRGIVYIMALAVVSVCGILLPEVAREEAAGKTNPPESTPFLIGAWALSIPVFVALYQILKILNYVDENKAFSTSSIVAVKIIKVCTAVFGVLFAGTIITTVVITKSIDPTEDQAGIVMPGLLIIFTASIIAAFAALLQRLLQNALDMKPEKRA